MRGMTIIIVALAFCIVSCTYTVRMEYKPENLAQPVRMEKPPRIFLGDIKDNVGNSLVPGGGTTCVFEPPLMKVLREALSSELGRLGATVVPDKAQADAVLDGTLLKCDLTMPGGTVFVQGCALVVQAQLSDMAGRSLWSEAVSGQSDTETYALDDCGGYRRCWQALSRTVASLGSLFASQGLADRIAAPKLAPAAAQAAPAAAAVRSDIDELPAKPEPAREDAYAVVIGVRRYQQALPGADFADEDAKLVRAYLTGALGYQDANVALLVDERASKSGLEKHIESWLPNRVRGGEVLVYFAGHGAPDPRSGESYLLPYDGDPTYLDKTGYPLKRLYAELGRLQARKVTVVLDSGFTGAGGRSVLARGARPLVSVTSSGALPETLTVLSAAAGDQSVYAYPEKGHGLFTYFLLKGLKERAGNLRAAFESAARQTPDLARREFNADQVPQRQGKP